MRGVPLRAPLIALIFGELLLLGGVALIFYPAALILAGIMSRAIKSEAKA